MNEIVGYVIVLVIGLLLGLLGGGGAILTIPVLVYMFHISPFLATTYSLFIVGLSSGAGAVKNWKNMIHVKHILLFAIPSTLAIIVIRNYILHLVPKTFFVVGGFTFTKDRFIMSFFALLLIVSGILMLVKGKNKTVSEKVAPWWKFLILGYIEGTITGIVGAGGGFIMVPLLVFLSKLEIKRAIAASLFIVSIKSLVSFFASPNLSEVNWMFILKFAIISMAGMFFGTFLSKKISTVRIKIIFGVFLIIMSIFIILMEFILNRTG
jgi:uncharacterized membrane protein YfcA